jgi:CBS domain containing-hemolysin-like protein
MISVVIPHTEVLSRVFVIFLLIAINAFFVAAQFAVVSVRRTRIQQLVQEGDLQAKAVQKLQRDIERLLSTTQIGITLSSLALGWMGERAIAQMLFGWLDQVNLFQGKWYVAHSLSITLSFLAIAYLQIFTPFVWVLNQSTRLLLRLLRLPIGPSAFFDTVTSKELQLMIESSSNSGDMEQDERELLKNVFESGDTLVEDVMVPRTSIQSIEAQSTIREFLEEVSRTGHLVCARGNADSRSPANHAEISVRGHHDSRERV